MSEEDTEVRVNVRTTEGTRDKWKQYAAENGDVDHMSHLIHRGVSEYIARHDGDHATGDGRDAAVDGSAADQLTDTLNDVVTAVEGLDARLDDIEARLDNVERHVGPTTDVDAADVVRALPPVRPHTEAWLVAQRHADEAAVAWDGTVTAVADHLDAPEERVREAIDRLRDGPIDIGSTVEGGTAAYWAPNQSDAADAAEKAEEWIQSNRGEVPPEARRDDRGDDA